MPHKPSNKGYVSGYTVEFYNHVVRRAIDRHGASWSEQDIKTACRYLATKGRWARERGQFVTSKEVEHNDFFNRLLALYDDIQGLFDGSIPEPVSVPQETNLVTVISKGTSEQLPDYFE